MRNELSKLLILIMISMFFVGCNQGNNDIKMKSKGGAVSSGGQKHSQKGDNSGDDDLDSDEISSSSEGVDGSMLSDEAGRVKREALSFGQFKLLIEKDLKELDNRIERYLIELYMERIRRNDKTNQDLMKILELLEKLRTNLKNK
ncbi:hypothetical protein DB313_04680 (plasmid) [Borrelia turcica IST7]|uniref:Lipoprotein n=1 Tax=Borrelia turcica IST7 TaxID=1104446 RepID=A0A386PPL0_9SPIR|nr:hypothetical protein [Borrelia turcica]AYE36797.1 hypothetical protein DB313_04680 [Borrelia turcica IST7]